MTKRFFLLPFFFFLPLFIASAQGLYWENPKTITDQNRDCRFPSCVSGISKKAKTSACFWQEIHKEENTIHLVISTTEDGITWEEPRRFAGPFFYSGDIPEMYSVAINSKGKIAVAMLSAINEISVCISDDGGKTFSFYALAKQEKPLVGPRIFSLANDGFIVFATLANGETFSMLYSLSKKGSDWTSFTEFPFSYPGTTNPLVPYMTEVKGGNLLVFQAHYFAGGHNSFQIFSSFTKDNGANWTSPILVTGEERNFSSFNNQRPMLFRDKNDVYMAWERSPYGGISSSIYIGVLNANGSVKEAGEQVSTRSGSVHPVIFSFDEKIYALWADSQTTNNKVYLSERLATFWNDPTVIIQSVSSAPSPVLSAKGKELSFIWQQQSEEDKTRNVIQMLLKDSSAEPPLLHPISFQNNGGGTSDLATLEVETSSDSSGIRGFSWLWTKDKNAEPEEEIMNMPQEKEIQGIATEDGEWYFKVKQIDYAGNWSSSATATYIRDTKAPQKPLIADLPLDSMGLMQSNSFALHWTPPEDSDIAGYTWALQYVDAIPQRLAVNSRHPLTLSTDAVESIVSALLEKNAATINAPSEALPRYIRTEKGETSTKDFINQRNGLYIFSVAAIDWVGNIGEASSVPLVLNKYIPSTYISTIQAKTNIFGDTAIEIFGGGFTYEGSITAVYFDKDGKAPYDYILSNPNEDFAISSDNRISNIILSDIEEGEYFVGLLHSDRGLYVSKNTLLSIKDYGTVKRFREYTFIPDWITNLADKKYRLPITVVLCATISLFALITFLIITGGLSKTAKESAHIKTEVRSLLEGKGTKEKQKTQLYTGRRKGASLYFKLSAYLMSLILLLLIALILALGYMMIQREEQTRAHGLQERVNVILDSISSGAKINLPNANSNLLALSDLTEESDALSDANYATITGHSTESGTTGGMQLDYVWATNDPSIAAKINTENVILGVSRLSVEHINEISKRCIALNATANESVSVMAQQISELTAEGFALAGKSDEESISRLNEISEITMQLNNRLDHTLDEIANLGIGSYPQYNQEQIDYDNATYLFYKPVLYHRTNDQTYVNGIVFVEISTQSLINEMHQARMSIVKTAAAIVGLALLLGFLITLTISAIIVKPINTLARHVAMIRDTDDKEALLGKDIRIKSKDEIGILGETVNEMTHGLVEAAVQAKNLTFGKEVQTRFLPLQSDEKGTTLTTGELHAHGADFFSYYAGADDLSGDYFDYKQLDPNHYAIIKCDVSGHGVPAALIMVEVATLFLNAFSGWNMKNKTQGTNLAPVVSQINDLIESRGFKGRFAAFTLALLNTQTGECWFCNAGDNVVQLYDGTLKQKRSITLPETPAAGMFSTELVNLKGGYKTIKITLKKNDVLFLYTDGIEESKRTFRNANCEPILCKEEIDITGDIHGNHAVGEGSEELTPERVTQIIETVFAKGIYKLKKFHNPDPSEDFTFDFSNCSGSAEDAIMALVSIEKIFRLYRPVNPKPTDRVKVDKKIDAFLRLHFKDYNSYCMDRSEIEADSTHIYYHGVQEDPQYDDLTLIAIKKN